MSRRTPRVFQDPTGAWRFVFTSTRRRPVGKRRQVRRRGFSVARVWRSGLAVLRRPGRRWLVLTAGGRGGWSRRWRGGALASVRDRGRGSWCRRRGGPCAATRAPGRTGRVGRRVYRQVQVANCSITTVGVGRLVRPNENAHCAGADDRGATPGVGEVGSVDVVAAPERDPGQSVAVGRRWGGDQRGGPAVRYDQRLGAGLAPPVRSRRRGGGGADGAGPGPQGVAAGGHRRRRLARHAARGAGGRLHRPHSQWYRRPRAAS
jgi:hypothetical protein